MTRAAWLGLLAAGALLAGGELRFCIRADPKTFNPLLVADEPSETVRYLTAGVLIRVNRLSQALEPELAESWKISEAGRKITFQLRSGLLFSDGSPFEAEDVAFTMRVMLDPEVHSPVGDSFQTGPGKIQTAALDQRRISITFPAAIAGLEALFDQVAMLSSRALRKQYEAGKFAQASQFAVLGPFRLMEYKPGAYVLLTRNPYYWKQPLPSLDSVRLPIQQNRDLEMLRFNRGELHLVNSLDPDLFQAAKAGRDLGPSLESEFLWFNQKASAPLPAYKKEWFRSSQFRRAVSEIINREDLCRVVYRNHATPATGPVSPANRLWFNQRLKPQACNPASALRRLEGAGFLFSDGKLRDKSGNLVEFSVVTNAGNKARERIAAMLQQDLSKLGIRLNVVTLDFASLIERIARNFNYEMCLLGLTNVDLDPNAQMSVWLSSGAQHQWNPGQKTPETAWETEIDRLMRAQASETVPRKRKAYFDRVQEIVYEEVPFIYLVNKNSLCAISPRLHNSAPAVLPPQTYWNAERLSLENSP